MRLTQVEKEARALMTQHGVGSLQFKFDGGKRRIGATHYSMVGNNVWLAHTISLSRHYAELLPMDELRDIILHEIAHVKAGHEASHGPKWKMEARKLGIKGDRCAQASARPAGRVTAECPECHRPLAEQHRLPQRIYVCKVHRNRALTWMKDGVKVPLEEMPQNYRTRYNYAMQKGIIR